MKKLLVIAYVFPPAGAVGVYRTLKFIKYLPEFGWQPVVLTVANGKFPVYDESLMKLVPEGVDVYSTPSWETLNEGYDRPQTGKRGGKTLGSRVRTRMYLAWNWFAMPDDKVGWVPNALRTAKRLIREQHIEHVYISGYPFSSFLISPLLKRSMNDVRVAIDFRDPWTLSINYPRRTPFHHSIAHMMEKRFVRASDLVISNTIHNNERIIAEYGRGARREKFVAIHNGFDAEDFSSIPQKRNDVFTITYAGAFYYSIGSDFSDRAGDETMKTYSPLYFFEALEAFLKRRPEAKERVRVRFMGVLGQGYDPVIKARGLERVIERIGYIDYDEHLRVLKQSDLLLLVLSRGEKSRGWIPSKFFQYLGTGNAILAMAPEGEVRDIVSATKSGVCVEPDDAVAASQALEHCYDAWQGGTSIAQPDPSAVAAYERRNLTAKLAKAIDSM